MKYILLKAAFFFSDLKKYSFYKISFKYIVPFCVPISMGQFFLFKLDSHLRLITKYTILYHAIPFKHPLYHKNHILSDKNFLHSTMPQRTFVSYHTIPLNL